MKKLACIFFVFSVFLAKAQVKDTTYWNRNVQAGINVNQSAFNYEWQKAQGGLNNAAISGFIFGKSEYVKYKFSLLNDLQLQYGLAYNQGNLKPAEWRKNLDRVFFDNKAGYALSNTWGIFASLIFQTQFDKGYKFDVDPNSTVANPRVKQTVISDFLAPGYLDEAAGLEWKPTSYFNARFGPVAFRQTLQTSDQVFQSQKKFDGKDTVAYGVKKGDIIRNQFGLNLIAKFDKNLTENINLKLIYQYFSAYENLAVSTNRLDAIATAKVFKFINVNLQATVLYNQDQINKIQVSQSLGLGVVYAIVK